jgi:hypothetical protein
MFRLKKLPKSSKNAAKNLAFLTRNTASLYKLLIASLFNRRTTFFPLKIGENSIKY